MRSVTLERDREMSLMEHLAELRTRLMIAAIAVLAFTAFSFIFTGQIIRWLLEPSGLERLQVLGVTEAFTTYFRVALFAGIALAMPVILYQLFRYIDPALHPHERRILLGMLLPVLALFAFGIAFCYYVVLPSAIRFLLNFGAEVFDPDIRATEYLSFVTTFMLGMGLVFEMPALIFALVKVRVLQRSWLTRQRRYVFLGAFVLAALLTPTPDPFNQALVGIPLYVLFELGLFLSRFA